MITTQKKVTAWVGDTVESSGPVENRSTTKSSERLKALLPKMLPIARSKAPMRTAAMVVVVSGRVVARATRVVPTKVSPRPVAAASSPAEVVRKGATIRIASAAAEKRASPPRSSDEKRREPRRGIGVSSGVRASA